MIPNKALLKPDIHTQIEIFYKLSTFLSKYSNIVLAIIFSTLFVLASLTYNEKVIAYSSNILNFSNLESNFIGIQDPNKISNKYLTAKYILSKTTSKGARLNLGRGLFITPLDIQLPSYISLNSIRLKELTGSDLGRILDRYYTLLNKSYYNPIFLKLEKNTKDGLTISQMKNKYNLSCINSIFKNSIFCNTNKFILIKDIENKKIDLSPDAYKELFKSLNIPKKDKCNILKKIYSKRLNYDNIMLTVQQVCDNPKDFIIVKDLVEDINSKLFSVKIPNTHEGQMHKLVNQWFFLLKNKNIPPDDIVAHISYVKKLLNNGLLVSSYLYIEYKILQYIKDNLQEQTSNSSLNSDINELISGNPIKGIKGIKSYIKDLIHDSDTKKTKKYISHHNSTHVKSIREKLLSLINNSIYRKFFTITEEPNFTKDTAILKGFLHLTIKGEEKVKIYKLPVILKINLKSIIGQKFTINSIKILDLKAVDYLHSKGIKIPKNTSLTSLTSYLSNSLTNYYLNGKKDIKLDFCSKAKLLGFNSCSNNTIHLTNRGKINFSIDFVFNNNRLVKINMPEKVTKKAKQSRVKDKDITINLTKISNKLNKILKTKEYTIKDINKIYNKIQTYINRLIKEKELQRIGMNAKQVVKVQSLFKKYLGVKLEKIKHLKKGFYNIYFTLGSYRIKVIYHLPKNKILKIYVYVRDKSKFIDFGKTILSLSNLDKEKLNLFKQDPDSFLKTLNPKAYSQLQQLLEKNK